MRNEFTTMKITEDTHTKIIRCRGFLQYKNPHDKITMDKAMSIVCDEFLKELK